MRMEIYGGKGWRVMILYDEGWIVELNMRD